MLSVVRVNDYPQLSADWQELHKRSFEASVFNSLEWQETWWTHFGDGAELLLWAGWEGEHLQAIAPLMCQHGIVSMVGGRAVSDYLDFIIAPGYETAFTSAVVDQLKSVEWHAIVLRGLRANSPLLLTLPQAATEAGWTVKAEVEDVCPTVRLPKDWDAYLASLGKKERHELRRKFRRLDVSASWHWYVMTGTSIQSSDLDDFVRLMRSSQPDKARFMDERMESFFRSALGRLLVSGIARLYFLEIDNERVASAACFDQGEELWLYNSGYDPRYSSLSVGLLLKALCLEDALGIGKGLFDFLRGSEPYKYDLGAVDRPVYKLEIRRQGYAGSALPPFPDER
ncbi:MAG: GNAT family N-acetyltransferase [Chloroflexota bacterium]